MKHVYVLLWELKGGGSWDVWTVCTDYGRACYLEEKLQEEYPDRNFFIFTEDLDMEIVE
jgi:hypothetical protein